MTADTFKDNLISELADQFGRIHRSLRISVTDVCNIRCQYCMPEDASDFMPKSSYLSFDAIERFVRWTQPLGIRNIRLTGGEPLLRRDLTDLVARLSQIEGLDPIALTSNGMLVAEHIQGLVNAGLRRLNISLDTLEDTVFQRISRRSGLQKVLDGIDAALACPKLELKLNALVLRDVNLDGVIDLVGFSIERDVPIRFIEFMPLDGDRAWNAGRMVGGGELRSLLESHFGKLELVEAVDASRPAREYRFVNGRAGRVGFIDSVSAPFCASCDRLRLTADGKVRNCLFGMQEWSVADLLAETGSELALQANRHELERRLHACVAAKHPAHGIEDPNFEPPERAMYQIGG